jgi:hypothetical protein
MTSLRALRLHQDPGEVGATADLRTRLRDEYCSRVLGRAWLLPGALPA